MTGMARAIRGSMPSVVMLGDMADPDHGATFDAVSALTAASKGDQGAWDAIVAQYSNLVWAVARGHRLSKADAADVYQGTWLRLVEHLDQIRDASRLGAWLCTTARRESLALIRRRDRDLPVADAGLFEGRSDPEPQIDERLLQAEDRQTLWRAFSRLSANCQRLLRVAFADPAPSYAEISDALDIPVGSIGPTRARCLSHLQALFDTA